ncbi:hypothetical protein E2C01_066619 [Portunus trituberculatus]|uniref:Uncharacterized protein n=1 Tax=Portunus trituberculatus TaxID=210409 RepID=A0A5B7HUB7_PORTR|nr:hypothetical protein [Portunus trituberculatus]
MLGAAAAGESPLGLPPPSADFIFESDYSSTIHRYSINITQFSKIKCSSVSDFEGCLVTCLPQI